MSQAVLLSKWWRTPSARAAFRRVAKARKERIKKLRETIKRKGGEKDAQR